MPEKSSNLVLTRRSGQRVRLLDEVSGNVTWVEVYRSSSSRLRFNAPRCVVIEREECVSDQGRPEPLPRRGDEDLREATDAPIFLIQRRVIAYHRDIPYDHDGDGFINPLETDEDGFSVHFSDDELLAKGHAFVDWRTERVGFDRAESEQWAETHKHNGPFRVYSVPAVGRLRDLLRRLTDYTSE